MCLERIIEKYPKEDHKNIYGYQVVRLEGKSVNTNENVYTSFHQHLEILRETGKVYKRQPDSNNIILTTRPGKYRTGFHVWTTGLAAAKWGRDASPYSYDPEKITVVKVKLFDVRTKGKQYGSTVYVGDKIKIIKEIK